MFSLLSFITWILGLWKPENTVLEATCTFLDFFDGIKKKRKQHFTLDWSLPQCWVNTLPLAQEVLLCETIFNTIITKSSSEIEGGEGVQMTWPFEYFKVSLHITTHSLELKGNVCAVPYGMEQKPLNQLPALLMQGCGITGSIKPCSMQRSPWAKLALFFSTGN